MAYFAVELQNGNSQVFLPASHVQGLVTLRLDSPVKCRGLRLVFRGEEYTYWVSGTGYYLTCSFFNYLFSISIIH